MLLNEYIIIYDIIYSNKKPVKKKKNEKNKIIINK